MKTFIIVNQTINPYKRNGTYKTLYTKWKDTGALTARFNFMCKYEGKRRIVEVREA